MSESTDRTESDRKGGHLARRREDGGLVLRETAQTTDEDMAAFEDIERHRFFNCNNIWVDLRALERTLAERDGVLGLPMIVNRKTVDPTRLVVAGGVPARDGDGCGDRRVRGRGRAAGAAHALRAGQDDQPAAGGALRRVRAGGRLDGSAGDAIPAPVVELDSKYYKLIGDFDARFPGGAPSLRECGRLEVDGDVTFGRDVAVKGEVRLEGPLSVPDGAVLEG